MDMIGLYPTFYVPEIGTAWVMGIIGVIHVVASHTSVGVSFCINSWRLARRKDARIDA